MLRHALALLAPPLCAVCSGPTAAAKPLCPRCFAALARGEPSAVSIPAADWALAAVAYEGTARALVTALKFRGRLALAAPMATALARAAGPRLIGATIVPVPPAPRRRRWRGFDPADEIAAALGRTCDRPLLRCLRRADGPRQVGRARHTRLASPPLVEAAARAPDRAVLIDDVVTTGASLTACALALRGAGALEVGAVAFARAE